MTPIHEALCRQFMRAELAEAERDRLKAGLKQLIDCYGNTTERELPKCSVYHALIQLLHNT